jgi:hypothetical protein
MPLGADVAAALWYNLVGMDWIGLPFKTVNWLFEAVYFVLLAPADLIWAALNFVRPASASDFWSAVEGLATLFVGVGAWHIARNQFELELMPVLHAERSEGKTSLTNRGRGLALELYGVKYDGDAEAIAPFLARDASIDYTYVTLSLTEPHWVYYTDANGGWYCVKFVGSSLTGDDREFAIGAETKRLRWRRLPKSIRSRKERLSRSAVEHYAALVNVFTTTHWRHRANERLKQFNLWWGKKKYGVRETARLKKYAHLADNLPNTEPDEDIIRKWDVDLRGISMACWHTHPIEVEQHAFAKVGDERMCKIARLRPFPNDPKVPGLVIVTGKTWKKLSASPRSARNDALFGELVKYLCGRSPKEFFVCVL